MLNMTELMKNNTQSNNIITINGAEFMVTDEVAMAIFNLCCGKSIGTKAQTKSEPKKSEPKKSDFPSLGAPEQTVGVITRYGKLVRNWEVGIDGKVGGFTSDKVRYATKKVIIESGAKWDTDNKAYAFPTVKAAKEFMQSQITLSKERELAKLGKAIVK